MSKSNSINTQSELEFVISRVYNAPRKLVFKVWTEAEHLMLWWGPKGFSMMSCKIDLKPGGVFHFGMRASNGSEMWGKWVFREIAEPERLVFVSSFSNSEGAIAPAPFNIDWPLEVLSTVTFTEHEGKTTINMRATPINASEAQMKTFESMFESMRNGWKGTLDQLEEYLAKA